jgi:STE24 endopeptidase
MTASSILFLIILIIVVSFLFEQILAFLNFTRMKDPIPEILCDVYEKDSYHKSQEYNRANYKFNLLKETISFIIILLVLWMGGFAWFDDFVRKYTDNAIFQGLLFFGIIGLASSFLALPFSIYHTFVTEEKFGFNRTSPKTFVFDLFKGWILAAILGGMLLAAIIALYLVTGPFFWIVAWGITSGFMLLITFFYSSVIVPLFNKQKPLEDGLLRDSIEAFTLKAGFALTGIFVIDGSKRSTKANAYFSGFGPHKRIVLYDTLIHNHSIGELVAILAHEIGHYKQKHVIKGILAGIVQTGFMFWLFSLMAGNQMLSEALGSSRHGFHMTLLAFGLLYSPVSQISGLVLNHFSRKHEYQADAYAAIHYDAIQLITGLKKLSGSNLSNLTPHPAYVFVNYSHPPLLQRAQALLKFVN